MLRLTNRTPPALLLRLPRRSAPRVLARIHKTAEQLIPPLICDEPVSPQHQCPILIVHNERDRDAPQVHDVVIPPRTVGRPDVDQSQPYPPVVVDRLLAERLPPTALLCHGQQRMRNREADTSVVSKVTISSEQ